MDRDDKHALFAAAALNALILGEQSRKPQGYAPDNRSIAIDAAWFADQLIQEVEKKP